MWSVSAGAGVPVVFVHGAFCDYRYFEPQIEAAAASWRAISVSLRGYHPGPWLRPDEFTAGGHVEELAAFLQSFGAPVHVVGHSRGGRIALNAAARIPQAIRSLVLIEPGGEMEKDFLLPAPQTATRAAAPDVRGEAWALIESGRQEDGLRRYIDAGHGEGKWQSLEAPLRRMMLANAGTLAGMMRDRSAPLSAAAARGFARPTLLIGGRQSAPNFARVLDALEAYLPDRHRSTIDNADHFLTWDRGAEVNAVLRDWLNARS